MKKLDEPLLRRGKTGPAIWKTIALDGVKYNVQVFLDAARLEREIIESILATPDSHEMRSGNVIVNLMRRS